MKCINSVQICLLPRQVHDWESTDEWLIDKIVMDEWLRTEPGKWCRRITSENWEAVKNDWNVKIQFVNLHKFLSILLIYVMWTVTWHYLKTVTVSLMLILQGLNSPFKNIFESPTSQLNIDLSNFLPTIASGNKLHKICEFLKVYR